MGMLPFNSYRPRIGSPTVYVQTISACSEGVTASSRNTRSYSPLLPPALGFQNSVAHRLGLASVWMASERVRPQKAWRISGAISGWIAQTAESATPSDSSVWTGLPSLSRTSTATSVCSPGRNSPFRVVSLTSRNRRAGGMTSRLVSLNAAVVEHRESGQVNVGLKILGDGNIDQLDCSFDRTT